jgi:type I phosphodiesterase/nucleotide pyrophosphatase
LLISVDGLHALDVARFVESNPNSALAELSGHGITYTSARTPANSDSFPGLLALVTGGSPISHGRAVLPRQLRPYDLRSHEPDVLGFPRQQHGV